MDPALAAHVGLTVDQVSQQVQDGLLGFSPTDFRMSDRWFRSGFDIPIHSALKETTSSQFPIVAANKQIVSLQSLANIDQARGQNELLRENQRLMVVLTARLEDRDLGSCNRRCEKVLADYKFPVGYTYEIGGQYETQQSSFRDLIFVLGLALAAVFTVLVIQFRAFLPALVIMSAAPMSMIGVFALLLITGTPLNVSSFMGIILMVGLVVKNGIILFEYYERLHGTMSYDRCSCTGRAYSAAPDSNDYTLYTFRPAAARAWYWLGRRASKATGYRRDRRIDDFYTDHRRSDSGVLHSGKATGTT